MQHRLFHTLVISSAMLLDGCASTHGTLADAGPPSDAVVTPDVDVRACEPGWPTTKGNFQHVLDDVALRCRGSARLEGGGVDVASCCVPQADG